MSTNPTDLNAQYPDELEELLESGPATQDMVIQAYNLARAHNIRLSWAEDVITIHDPATGRTINILKDPEFAGILAAVKYFVTGHVNPREWL